MNSKLQTEGILALEAPFIKVPLEQLKKSFKVSQKIIEKDLNSLVNSIVENSETSKENVKSKLNSLKRKLTESKNEENIYVNKTAKRLAELSKLSGISAVDSEEYERWSRLRLNRILVDYLLRKNYNNSGEKLAQDAGIQDLVDLELFRNSAHLQNCIRGHSVSEALLWCKENSSSLKKNKSSLEFNLRFQEYIELARNRKLKEAIGYAKKYLTAWSDSHLKEIQQGMALLAFSPETSVGIYKVWLISFAR
jgi:macrophage erythroblast attacher